MRNYAKKCDRGKQVIITRKKIYPELHGEKSKIALLDRKTIHSDSSTGAICRQERNAITYADSLKENHEGSWFQVEKSGKVVKDDTYKNCGIFVKYCMYKLSLCMNVLFLP